MGTVYLAQQHGAAGFQRLVAVKRAHPHLLDEPATMRMFAMEAYLSSLLRHPHVVGVTDLEEVGGDALLVMDYIEGATLAELVRQAGRPIPVPIAIRLLLDACAGLDAIHRVRGSDGDELGLVHRDVSPQNILVDLEGVARIADLGVARACAREGSVSVIRGKPSYMAPEYLLSGRATRGTDIYALGVVAWEVLTGRKLVTSATDPLASPRARDVPPSAHAEGIPRALDAVVARALSVDPTQRHASAKELGDALEAAAFASRVASRREVGALVEELFGERLEARREVLKHTTPIDPRELRASRPEHIVVPALVAPLVPPSASRPPAERTTLAAPRVALRALAPRLAKAVFAVALVIVSSAAVLFALDEDGATKKPAGHGVAASVEEPKAP